MLELHDPGGAFERLERWLADELREGESADVYLGYGLSEPLRRGPAPPPPEPCPLPLLAARPTASANSAQRGFRVGEWSASWSPEAYAEAIEAVRAAIARGDVYQVNVVQHLEAHFEGDPAGLATALAPLRPLHPSPFVGRGWAVVSASPELFLARRGDRLVTMPIKGTRPAGEDVDDAKDAAEHVMIVDLERNDLARVCEPGSIRWPELMRQRELAGVTHLVSTVEGRIGRGTTLAEILAATFPGGSVTGAPKISALDHIAALEPVGRGASMGAIGRFHANGDFDLALTIRTFAVADGRIHLWVGGGIVWDSDPEAEIEEAWVTRVTLLAVAVAGRGLVSPDETVFTADDEALLRGGAAFETLRVYGGRPFLLDRHLERLRASAEALALPAPDGAGALVSSLVDAAPPEHVLRIYRTERVLLATASVLPDDLDAMRTRGLTLQTVETSASTLLQGVKSTSYAEAFAARRAVDADDALLVFGDVVRECATANIWWRHGETLYTPAAGAGVLPGVTRGFLLEHQDAEEGAFRLDDLLTADEAFTTSSIREVMPVVAVNGLAVGNERPGPIAARLQALLRLRSSE